MNGGKTTLLFEFEWTLRDLVIRLSLNKSADHSLTLRPSYFDLLECHSRNGMPIEGRVITANAIQSNWNNWRVCYSFIFSQPPKKWPGFLPCEQKTASRSPWERWSVPVQGQMRIQFWIHLHRCTCTWPAKNVKTSELVELKHSCWNSHESSKLG